MCGICGYAGLHAPHLLTQMSAAMRHRGPDDSGEWYNAEHKVGLAHRRLSIIDLNPRGRQPMQNEDATVWLTFNGEIYNYQELRRDLVAKGHRFASETDSEVLIHLYEEYGEEMLGKLNGMFAFAIYDCNNRSSLLARDHIGIKPLYYFRTPTQFIFASEIRAILASKQAARSIDRRGLTTMLAYGAVQHPFTLFDGIHSLAPGGFLRVALSKEAVDFRAKQYWNMPGPQESERNINVVDSVRDAVTIAVRDQLLADVPVGVFLSSGIDSTILAALAAQISPGIRSFTVGFDHESDRGELDLAKHFASGHRLTHTEIVLKDEDARHDAMRWLDSIDSPSIDGLNTFIISQAVKREGITVALSGLGGDELFCGYSTFARVLQMRKLFCVAPSALRNLAGIALALLANGRSSVGKSADLLRSNGSITTLTLLTRRLFTDRQLQAFNLIDKTHGSEFLSNQLNDLIILGGDAVALVSQAECLGYMSNTLLRDTDVNSMAHSLEVRVPYLDRRVVELASSLPGIVRMPPGQPAKYLLRAAFPEIVQSVNRNTKRGFTLPLNRWMCGSLRELCEANIAYLKQSEVVSKTAVEATWNDFLAKPASGSWSRALGLVVLGSYLKKQMSAE